MARSASGTADFVPWRSSDRSGWLRATCWKPASAEIGEALETVRIDGGTRSNVLGEERNYRGGFEVRDHAHAGSTGSFTTLFDGHQDEGGSAVLELSAPSETGLFPANPCVINLHLSTQPFPNRVHHRPAKFVKHHPGSLVTGKTELTLEQQCGHSTLVRRHQICRPEPVAQRGLRPVKNGPGGQRDLVTALDALLASLLHQLIGSAMTASRTDEAIRPPTSRQILLAGLFRGEVQLKLAERLRERRSRHHSTLPVGVC